MRTHRSVPHVPFLVVLGAGEVLLVGVILLALGFAATVTVVMRAFGETLALSIVALIVGAILLRWGLALLRGTPQATAGLFVVWGVLALLAAAHAASGPPAAVALFGVPLLLLTPPALGGALGWSHLPRPTDAPACAACGYPLRGLLSNRCPECGELAAPPTNALQAEARRMDR